MSQGMLLPEFVIQKTLVSIVELLRKDLAENSADEKNSILYKIMGLDEEGEPLQLNLYNVFKQAKKIITTPNNLSVNFGYNQEVANIISLHILLPSENGKMTIGADEGYLSDDIIEDGKKVGTQEYFTQMFDTTYQIMITSNNSAEVSVVYNILKSMLLMLVPQLEIAGLRLPTLSGNDVVMQDDLVPVPLFHKVINISFTYEHNVPKMLAEKVARNFYYQWRLVSPCDDNSTKAIISFDEK